MLEPPPDEYQRFIIESVREAGERLTIGYGGHVFGGVVRCALPSGVGPALRPGTELFVRYHDGESGALRQVAHMMIRHPSEDGWAEIYSDGV